MNDIRGRCDFFFPNLQLKNRKTQECEQSKNLKKVCMKNK